MKIRPTNSRKQKELQELDTNRARVQEQFNQEKREIHQTKLQKPFRRSN